MDKNHLDAGHTRHHDAYVRTTLTIDDDVAQELTELMHSRRTTFKDTVNHVLRQGLRVEQRGNTPLPPYRTELFASAFRPGTDPLRLNQLSDEIDAAHAPADAEQP